MPDPLYAAVSPIDRPEMSESQVLPTDGPTPPILGGLRAERKVGRWSMEFGLLSDIFGDRPPEQGCTG
jgi:hypothetical protein